MTSRLHWALALVVAFVAALALAACGGTSTMTAGPEIPSSGDPGGSGLPSIGSEGSGLTTCIDRETADILQALTAPGADIEAILAEQGDALLAGLDRFTPPPEQQSWKENLVTAVENRDIQGVDAEVDRVGKDVVLSFCDAGTEQTNEPSG